MTTVLLCGWALSMSCVAGALIWDWAEFCLAADGLARSDRNAIEGRTLIDPEVLSRVVRGAGIVLALALAPALVAHWSWNAARRAARAMASKLPCRHRVNVRCYRCGKTRYRVDGPDPRVVVDEQYPDWD